MGTVGAMPEPRSDPPSPRPETPTGLIAAETDAVPDPETTTAPDPTTTSAPAEREWWDDPRLPWRGQPGRADIWCWTAFGLTGLYGLILLPLRPILLGANPFLLAALGGSRTSLVTIGALAATGNGWWPLGLALGTIGAIKFDPIYFWAGRLWGRGLIEIVAGRSARAARNAHRAERLAERFGILAVVATFFVPLLPSAVVFASVGAAKMRWRTFLLVDIASSFLTRALYLYLGYRIGQPAIDVVKVIATYSWWISLALLAGIIIGAIYRAVRRRGGETEVGPGASVTDPTPADSGSDGA